MFKINDGVTIEVDSTHKYHSYNDLNMILTSAVSIGAPKLRTEYINVPLRNGLLDVSESLIAYPTYENRPVNITFEAVNTDRNWDGLISNIRNLINGRKIKLIFDNDKLYYWYGRCSVENFERNMNHGKFVLNVDCEPYKLNITTNGDPWIWDTFSFVDGVIQPAQNTVHVDGTAEYEILKGNMPAIPQFITVLSGGDNIKMTYKNKEYLLTSGTTRFPSVKVNYTEDITLGFEGHGDVTVLYRGGSL